MKVTTKIVNGRISRQIDGKQVGDVKAFKAAYDIRGEKAITVFTPYDACHSVQVPSLSVSTTHNRCNGTRYNVKMSVLGEQQLVFSTNKNLQCAKEVLAAIENAFFGGADWVEIDSDGNVKILRHGSETVSELESAANTVTETEIDAIEDYAVSEEAFDLAVAWEIEFAEQAAYEAKRAVFEARMLADDELAARYQKAKSQVKCERYIAWIGWYFKGKNRDEWEYDATKAAACLTRYGLSRVEFMIFHDAEVAVIESNGYDETAFDLLPTVDELNDFDDEIESAANTVAEAGKSYTLTIHATEDFKELYGSDTLVKNFDTCQHLYNGGKRVIFTNNWELERGGKTIATGDGIKDFCRFITCEFDVSERLAEIADAKSVDMEICGEHVYFMNGKCVWVMSPKYHASFHVEAGIDGNEHYEIFTADKNGKFTRGNFVTEEEFFNVMIERGGCTIVAENQLPEIKPEFKRYGSFKNKAAHIDATIHQLRSQITELYARVRRLNDEFDADIFAQDKIEVDSPADAMALMELVARDKFEFYRNRDEDCREFRNVRNMEPEYGTFTFSEHFTDGELTRVEFQKGVNFGSQCVEIYIKPASENEKVTVKNSADAWELLKKRFTGEFKFSAKFTPPDGITTATYYNRESNLRLDVTSDDGEEFYFAICEIDNQPFVIYSIDVDPTLDEDEAAEKFYRETAATYREMQAAAYNVHKFLTEKIFDIYDFDYALSVRDQGNEFKACPNKFHLVDTRFDVEVDRNNLEYVIYFGGTELARYRKIESVNNAVDQLVIAIVNHRFEFAFPAENESEDDMEIYPIDVAIYHGGNILTEAELEDYAAQFRDAITANDNLGVVEIGESYLSVYGNTGGDNKTIWKLIGDLCWRGECVLEGYGSKETDYELREMPGEEIDALLARMGIDNAEPETSAPTVDELTGTEVSKLTA